MENQQTQTAVATKTEETVATVVTEKVIVAADAGVQPSGEGEGEGEVVAAEVAPVAKEEAPLQLTPVVGLVAVLLVGLVAVAVVRLRK